MWLLERVNGDAVRRVIFYQLLRSGSVELNPGPMTVTCDPGEFGVADLRTGNYTTFSERTELLVAFKKYCDRTFQPFVKQSTNSNQIYLRCKHGFDRESKSTGKRPLQGYYWSQCPAFIYFSKRVRYGWHVADCCFEHIGHAISSEQYATYPGNSRLTIKPDLLVDQISESATVKSETPTSEDKFQEATLKLSELATVLSQCPPEQFDGYMANLDTFLRLCKEGTPIEVTAGANILEESPTPPAFPPAFCLPFGSTTSRRRARASLKIKRHVHQNLTPLVPMDSCNSAFPELPSYQTELIEPEPSIEPEPAEPLNLAKS